MHYIDLHSHVLWGIDDGAQSLDDSVQMLGLLSRMGFGTVYATPHQKVDVFVPTAEEIAERFHDVERALGSTGLAVSLHLGAENFWDELFLTRALSDTQPSYRASPEAENGKAAPAFLFELPIASIPPRLEEQLFSFRLRGRLPVLAHPERYVGLWKQWDRVASVARCTALVVDLAAIDGAHGAERARAARRMVQEGLCHAAASDVHHPSDARAVAAGMQWIKKKLGERRLSLLLADNPRQILGGELPDLPG